MYSGIATFALLFAHSHSFALSNCQGRHSYALVIPHYALVIFEVGLCVPRQKKKRRYLIKESPRNGAGNKVAR